MNFKSKISIWERVAPKDRISVCDRFKGEGKGFSYDLIDYLQREENVGLEGSRVSNPTYCQNKKKRIKLNLPFKNKIYSAFGFDVEVTSNQRLPLEEMLDLDALNEFVLTGKTKDKF